MKTHSLIVKQYVVNESRRFGSTDRYVPAVVLDGDKYVPVLFTRNELMEAMKRAAANPEDAPQPSWIARIVGWFNM